MGKASYFANFMRLSRYIEVWLAPRVIDWEGVIEAGSAVVDCSEVKANSK